MPEKPLQATPKSRFFDSLLTFPSLALALALVLIARALRLVLLFRFGVIGGTGRIGNLAPDVEFYLSNKDENGPKPRSIDLFYWEHKAFNLQFKTMAQRQLHVFNFVKTLDRVNRKLPGWKSHFVGVNSSTGWLPKDLHGLIDRTPTHLPFLPDEIARGNRGAINLGIPDGEPFICFHGRDSVYLDTFYPEGNWRYHDFRNCSIQNYVPAAEAMAQRGLHAVRMGAAVAEGINSTDPNLIDYALNGRSDFMDVYLPAHCKFFLSSAGGIEILAMVYRRPIACANFVPVGNPYMRGPRDIFIPKKLWLRSEERFLSFREIIQTEIGNFSRSEQYEERGIDAVENTANEILALALEMDERLNGTWVPAEEDAELQKRFWSLYKQQPGKDPFNSRLGAVFLRENAHLLD